MLFQKKGFQFGTKALFILLENAGDRIALFQPSSSFGSTVDRFVSVQPPPQYNTVVVLFPSFQLGARKGGAEVKKDT